MTEKTVGLADALAQVQTQLPSIGKSSVANVPTKTGGSYSFKYADLADVSAAVLPLLGKSGLSWLTMPTIDEHGNFVLRYELLHTSGENRVGFYPLPASSAKPQELGSAITYARRYTLCSMVGVTPDEDDDGQAAASAPARQHHPGLAERRTEVPAQAAKPVAEKPKTPQEQADVLVKWLMDVATVKGAEAGSVSAEKSSARDLDVCAAHR